MGVTSQTLLHSRNDRPVFRGGIEAQSSRIIPRTRSHPRKLVTHFTPGEVFEREGTMVREKGYAAHEGVCWGLVLCPTGSESLLWTVTGSPNMFFPSLPGFLSHTLDPGRFFRSEQIKCFISPLSELFAHSSGRWNLIEIPDDNSDVKALCKHPCSINTSEHTRERQREKQRQRNSEQCYAETEMRDGRVTET